MRLMSLLAAAGVVVAGGVTAVAPSAQASVPTAQTGGGCSLLVQSRVTVSSDYREIPLKLGSNCKAAGVANAYWLAYHPSSSMPQNGAIFEDGAQADWWDLYDDEPLGRWTWRPDGVEDANYDPVNAIQNTPYTDVRLGSWARVVATRSGSKVTLSTSAARYAYSLDKFVGWAGVRGQIQYFDSAARVWRGVKDVYSNSTGKYTYTYTMPTARSYRVYFPGTSSIWGVVSPTIYK